MVEIGEHHVTPESDVLFALLLFLSMSAGRAVPRAELLDLLWPDSSPSNARHRLRQALYQLKKMGAPLSTPDSYVNLRETDVEVDYVLGARNRQALTTSVAETAPGVLNMIPAPGWPISMWITERPAALWEFSKEHSGRGERGQWYAEDKGRHAIAEILSLIEK